MKMLERHAFRDLPFSFSLLTDSLVYYSEACLAARKINVSGVFFPPFRFLSFSPEKNKPDCRLLYLQPP